MKNNHKKSRRDFIKKSSLITLAGIAGASTLKSFAGNMVINSSSELVAADGLYTLPALPYASGALEPYIDKMTMETHHDKHHAGYVNNLNKAVTENKLQNISLEEILKNISKYPASVRNNGGGQWNHSFFWKIMNPPKGGDEPNGALMDAIKSSFGSFDAFKTKFSDAASKRFGSGWAWLIVNKDNKLEVTSTPNQDNPLMDISEIKGTPVLGLDVWEHAYYLKYQNKRADYITSWWNIVNWEEAAKNFSDVKK